MSDVKIHKKNEVYIKLECEPHILYELQPYFTFEIEGAKFMPQMRSKMWDGQIRLLSTHTGEIYAGLLDKVIAKLKTLGYTYELVENKYYGLAFEYNDEITLENVKEYIRTICSEIKPRDYQIDAVYQALRFNRKLLLSPTSSGKSLIIYSIIRYFCDRDMSVLIIVPTTSLVEQMYKDFIDYGWDSEKYVHRLYQGKEQKTDKLVTCSTWQSIYKNRKSYFEEFDVVIGDECHTFKSKSLCSIMTKLHHTKYRYGLTGTLDGSQTHKWVIEGLFGPSYTVTKLDDLMNKGYSAKLDIKCVVLKHKPKKFDSYEDEIQELISNEKRNKFISNLTLSMKTNTLVLFTRVETHGQLLFDLINSNRDDSRKVFFIHGGVKTDERELIREITENESNAIIIASYGVFSTGINIKNLHNVIFASPYKSRIKVLQSLGRGLRVTKDKDKVTLYDISDDFSTENRNNYTLNHFIERVKIYNEENFNYKITNINF
jgi:superfamily II DNA or RNA helicase